MNCLSCRKALAHKLLLLVLVAVDTWTVESKVCLKRQEIGTREGNLYTCEDPVLSECCESNMTFQCCQPAWKENLHGQMWIVLAVVVMALLMYTLISWCTGQSELFKLPTAKEALVKWKKKLTNRS